MADSSWHIHPVHAHKLSSSDPWTAESPNNMAGPSSVPVSIPTHYQSAPIHLGSGAESREIPIEEIGDSFGRRSDYSEKGKGKEREREVMDLVKYDVPVWLAVMGDMMDSSKGRDKVLKCAQYSLKTYLYLLSLVFRIRPLSRGFLANRKRVAQAVSSLSLTRKCLILLAPIRALSHLLSPSPTSAPTILRHLLDLASGVADDLFCCSRLGLVNRRLGMAGDKWSARIWLLNTVMALYKLHFQTLPRLRDLAYPISDTEASNIASTTKAKTDLVDAEWTNRKLLADLTFATYDVFHLTWFSEPIKALAGLTSALIGTSKIYDQHWRASLKKIQ